MIKSTLVFLSLAAALTAHAAAPQYLPLQGVLTDPDGVPLNASVAAVFGLYTTETGGSALWTETQTVNVQDGLFVAYLGTVQTLSLDTFRDNGSLWLGVKVGSDAEMTRVRLGSTPFSGYAEYCGNVPTHTHTYSQITGTLPSNALPAGVVVGAQACNGSDKVMGVDAAGAIVCGADTGFTTEGQLTALLDDNYKAASWVPAWSDVTGKPAGLVAGAQACNGTDKVTGVDAAGAIVCAADADTNTTYLNGTGLTLSGSTFAVDPTVVQSRVTGTCPANSSIQAIAQNGTVTCQADRILGWDSYGTINPFAVPVTGALVWVGNPSFTGMAVAAGDRVLVNGSGQFHRTSGTNNQIWVNLQACYRTAAAATPVAGAAWGMVRAHVTETDTRFGASVSELFTFNAAGTYQFGLCGISYQQDPTEVFGANYTVLRLH